MITVRSLLSTFHIDRCGVLDIIERYKEKKSKDLDYPYALRVLSIITSCFVVLLFISVPIILIVGDNLPSYVLLLSGYGSLLASYFLYKLRAFAYQYLALVLLLFGFATSVLGMDAFSEEPMLSVYYMAGAAFVLLALTYNMFNNNMYHFYAVSLLYVLLIFIGYSANLLALQGLMMVLLLISLCIFILPVPRVNLYVLGKAVIIMTALNLFLFQFYSDFNDNSLIFDISIGLMIIGLGITSCFYKKKPYSLIVIGFSIALALISMLSSYLVGFSFIVLILAYIFNSHSLLFFGLFYHFSSALLLYFLATEEAPALSSYAFIGIGVLLLLFYLLLSRAWSRS